MENLIVFRRITIKVIKARKLKHMWCVQSDIIHIFPIFSIAVAMQSKRNHQVLSFFPSFFLSFFFLIFLFFSFCVRQYVLNFSAVFSASRGLLYFLHLCRKGRDVYNTGLFISPSGISELDCATTKTDTAERSISIGRESLQAFFFFCTRGLGLLPGSTARVQS